MKLITAMLAVGALLLTCVNAGQFGTGFAISPKGYLVTCHHVVRGAERVIVHHRNGYLEATIVALDPRNDLAILKVEGWPGRYLGLSSSSEVTHASEVLVAGFPDPTVLGRNPKVSTGIVNALSGVRDDPRFIQISAPVQPGNSGGPLLSPSGRVVGVVAAGLNSMDRMTNGGYLPQTVNYAIKTDLILPLLKNASISVPKFGTRIPAGPKQVERSLSAIALIEGLKRGERMYGGEVPRPPMKPEVKPGREGAPAPTLTSFRSQNGGRPDRIGPWVFPDSHARPLESHEVQGLPKAALWRARNEIYLRHGFIFPTPEGRRFASEFGPHYRPVTASVDAIKERLTPVEVANLRLISRFE
jgi:S1-C subfamily serine protease